MGVSRKIKKIKMVQLQGLGDDGYTSVSAYLSPERFRLDKCGRVKGKLERGCQSFEKKRRYALVARGS